jgi:hypothetical protein
MFSQRGMSESRVTYQVGTEPDRAREPSGFFVPQNRHRNKEEAACRTT